MPEDVHEIISYSSDFITSIRNNVNGISKKVHKQIFASRIWKPRSIQHRERKTLLTVKSSVQRKCLNFVSLNFEYFVYLTVLSLKILITCSNRNVVVLW